MTVAKHNGEGARGKMFGGDYHDRLEQAIEAAEQGTNAEIVVVLTRSSGLYRDVDHRVGALLAVVALALLIYTPYAIPATAALGGTAFFYLLGMLLSGRSKFLRRLFTTSARRSEQAQGEARLAFFEAGVRGTKERNGLLLFYSELERELVIIPDIGIERRNEDARWNQIRHDAGAGADIEGSFLQAVTAVGALLAQLFPATEDDTDEIPNRPRIRE